ncbi:hypothetical protein HY311_01500 [Candidatus Nomurabacteria bacterium]|nr:hypothetical protein [Candidatus Nomurabacteria bacterium]
MRSIILIIIIAFSVFFLKEITKVSALTITVTANVPGCGNNVIDAGEQCDGINLGGSSCLSRGFASGSLSCTSICTFNTSICNIFPPVINNGGGGGGGGGNNNAPSSIPNTNVVFTGRAYPKSTVTLLKDAQVVAMTVADTDANFQVTISGLSSGSYIFSVYSEDSKGIRSSFLTFPLSVTEGVTTKVGGIFIAPTITTDKSEVKQGDNLAIFGQSTPSSEVTVSINSENELFVKKTTDANGTYLINFDTSQLEMGQHSAKSKAALGGDISSFGKVVGFTVGAKNVIKELTEKVVSKADINNDNKVNLVDFSITAYWYKRPNPPKSADINGDGKVDLVDFSIMAFNWTG